MKYCLFIFVIAISFILVSCERKKIKTFDPVMFAPPPMDQYPKGFKPDSSDLYANIKFDKKQMQFVFPESFNVAELNKLEMQLIDSLINVAVRDYNRESKKKGWGQLKDLKNYRRQLVTVIDTNGVKLVYVNAFATWALFEKSWKKRLPEVSDGGSSYFHLFINFKKRKYYKFGVNGMA